MAGGNTVLLWSQIDISLNFQELKFQRRPAHLKLLERQQNTASSVFQTSAVLNDKNWNTFRVK